MTTIEDAQNQAHVIHRMCAPKVNGLFYGTWCAYVALVPVSLRYNPYQPCRYSDVESVDWVTDIPESRKRECHRIKLDGGHLPPATFYLYSQSLATYDNALLYTCSEGDINIRGNILVTKGSYTSENEVIDISFDDVKLVDTVLWW